MSRMVKNIRHDDKMEKHIMTFSAILMSGIGCLSSSCLKEEPPTGTEYGTPVAIEVQVSAEMPGTRAFSNDGTQNVSRILVLPFRKISEDLPDEDRYYVPSYTLAVQKDIDVFPAAGIILHLPVQTTYKVLVIGYGKTDYNYNDRGNPANKFDIGSVTQPATLADFHLYPKSAAAVPEFFTCICTAYNGTKPAGTSFRPEQGYSLSGRLSRIVSGLSVSITGIPAFVKSVSLVAENLTKASKATDGSIVLSQTSGDGGNRQIRKKVPAQDRTIVFNEYLLPTFSTNKTRFFLDVEYGAYTQRYMVKVPDSSVSSDNRLVLNPNQAINISGDYSMINIGFSLGLAINLDDDAWDGIK